MATRDVMKTLKDAELAAIRELNAIRAAISAMAETQTTRVRATRRGRARTAVSGGTGKRKRRRFSAAARRRMSIAQKARWAKRRANKKG